MLQDDWKQQWRLGELETNDVLDDLDARIQ